MSGISLERGTRGNFKTALDWLLPLLYQILYQEIHLISDHLGEWRCSLEGKDVFGLRERSI